MSEHHAASCNESELKKEKIKKYYRNLKFSARMIKESEMSSDQSTHLLVLSKSNK